MLVGFLTGVGIQVALGQFAGMLGVPSIGLPNGITRVDIVKLVATSVSMLLVILAQSAATSRAYAVKYNDRFVENDDLVGLALTNLSAGLTWTFPVNGSPTKTEMAAEAGSRSQVATRPPRV